MKHIRDIRAVFAVLACTVLLTALLPLTVRADTGPKPSVRITFENLRDEVCYATLLSEESSTGPQSVWDGDEEHIRDNGLGMDIWRAFADYKDDDGFFFLQCAWEVRTSGQLAWTYFPPETFKILLYYPESDEFAVSGICKRYAFDSYFTVDAAQRDQETVPTTGAYRMTAVRRSYEWGHELVSFAARVLITIAAEMAVALLFGIRGKRACGFLLAVNAGTQLLLNIALNLVNYRSGELAFVFTYIWLELFVFVAEAVAYSCLLPRRTGVRRGKWYYILYALAANAVSFGAGLAIARLLPGIF